MTKQFLEITDLPQDSENIFHGLRIPLVAVFNKCREYPAKMTAFKALIKFMYVKITAFEAEAVKAQEAREVAEAALAALADTDTRNTILAEAESLGINLDERLSTENLAAELSAAIDAKEAETAENAA